MVVWAEAKARKAEKASASAISFAIVGCWLCDSVLPVVGIYGGCGCKRGEVIVKGDEF